MLRGADLRKVYREEDGSELVILDGVDLTVERGEAIAVIGASGAGKSTLLHLLLRFYDPDAGAVRVDGVPLATCDAAAWRRRLAYVGQDAHLFNAAIRDNITCGRPGATQDAVEAAARKAYAHDFVASLPEGYDTPVADLGVRLSGGQRQRIALARALLRDPEILVLDEATNALDSLAEQAIQEMLDAERHRRTLVVVAHRLATIRQADHIVVVTHRR